MVDEAEELAETLNEMHEKPLANFKERPDESSRSDRKPVLAQMTVCQGYNCKFPGQLVRNFPHAKRGENAFGESIASFIALNVDLRDPTLPFLNITIGLLICEG